MALVEEDQQSGQANPSRGEHRAETGRPGAHGAPARGEQGGGEQAAGTPRPPRRRRWIIAAVAILIIAGLGVGTVWWLNARQYESTDDAFIDARVVPISAQVAGRIVAVPVTDNQSVATGVPLLRIDPHDYRVAVEQAHARLEEARAQVGVLGAQIIAQKARFDQAQKQVTAAEAALQYARQQNTRAQRLLRTGTGTVQASQQASAELTQRQAGFAGAKANATAADKQLGVLRAQQKSAAAQVDAAKATLDKAKIDLTRTTILAPQDGHVANLTAAVGAYAQPGQGLMAIVPRQVWVTANFKETQLAGMHAGQPVTIKIDAYPGKTFHGHVQSIQSGSGVAFSLLPPENATGNFVKVVQRVPVKIVFNQPPHVLLGPGMSVVPSVKVR